MLIVPGKLFWHGAACIKKQIVHKLNSVVQSANVFVQNCKIAYNNKGTSLLCYKIYYGCESFFDVSPRPNIFQVIPSALLVNIRLGWQGLPGISTLDLYTHL